MYQRCDSRRSRTPFGRVACAYDVRLAWPRLADAGGPTSSVRINRNRNHCERNSSVK